jgi:putative aldouronate transport system permease protein
MVMQQSTKGEKIFLRLNIIVLLILTFIAAVPFLSVIALSFSSKLPADLNQVSLWPVKFTFASWKYILVSGSALWKSFGLTLITTIIGTILALLVTAMMAYPLSKGEFKLSKVLMLAVIITMIFKAPIVPYFLTVKGIGLYNNFLVLIVPHIFSAFNLAIMRTFFKQFPAEVEEAAFMDGCGYFRILFKIILPSSTAVLATLGLFYGLAIWNQFQHPMMFITDTKLFPLQMKIRQLISDENALPVLADMSGINYNERTLRAATIVFSIIPVALIYPYLQKYFVKGAMLGSVKG